MSGGIPSFEMKMNSRRRKDGLQGHIVHAQSIKDSTYMESMVNFFHDIGQAYSNTAQTEEKETVLWARIFDYKTVLDPCSNSTPDGSKTEISDSLLLVLGYKNGIQAWEMKENGEIQETFSFRQGPVKTACLVPPPSLENSLNKDENGIARPLLAVCMAADKKQLFTSVTFYSLRTGDLIKMVPFDNDVEQLRTGLEGMLLVTFKHEIQALNTIDFSLLFTIRDCYNSPSIDSNPIAVGKEWLAYSPAKNLSSCQSAGGMEDDGINSYAATVINAAKTIKKGLVNLSETVNWLAKSSIAGGEEHSTTSTWEATGQRSRNQSGSSLPELSDGVPGLVTVINVPKLCKHLKNDLSPPSPGELPANGTLPAEAVVAHFPAHDHLPIVCMEFSPCGSLLATADKRGHAFHVFSILPHPVGSKMGAVHHIYSLYRGDTSAKVQEMSFSADCRWLSVSTLRGTSHVFPIAPCGGTATVRTHVNHRIVNRSSLFHKSAGLEDMVPCTTGFGGGNSTEGANTVMQVRRGRTYSHGSGISNTTNPRLPPHPRPTLVQPLAQIGSTRSQHVLNIPKITGQSPHSASTDKSASSGWQVDVKVTSKFTNAQLRVSRSSNGHDNALRRVQFSSESKGGQCLLIFSSSGILTEYHLDPKPSSGISKVSDDSPIELTYIPRFQWLLQRLLTWGEVTLPLQPQNPILEVDDRRRACINERLDMTSSLTSSSSKNSDHQQHINEAEQKSRSNSLQEDLPQAKTQQPKSRNFRLPTKPSSNNHPYPGTAVPERITSKFKSLHSAEIIPTGPHSDHFSTPTERLNGQILTSHCQQNDDTDARPSSAESVKSTASLNLTDCDEWLAQVEMISHEGPARRLWMGPQFCFKLRQSTGSTTLLSSTSSAIVSNRGQPPASGSPPEGGDGRVIAPQVGSHQDPYPDEDLDLRSLMIQTNRSDPMPTPKSALADHQELNSITIEAGSGNFDRAANLLEMPAYGSVEDRRWVSVDCEDRLKERIADAMLDSEINTKPRDIRTKSDSSEVLHSHVTSYPLVTAGEFDFDSENHSPEVVEYS